MISVMIIDAQRDTREGVGRAIDQTEGMQCVADFAAARPALVALKKARPDVILLDIQLPDMSGRECIQAIRRLKPHVNMLLLADSLDDDILFAALRAGVYGFWEKPVFPSTIIGAVRDIHAGGAPMSQDIARRVVSYFSHNRVVADELSEREQGVFQLLCEGMTAQEIADRLHVSANTVRFHLKNIYRKLGVNSRYEALRKVYHRATG